MDRSIGRSLPGLNFLPLRQPAQLAEMPIVPCPIHYQIPPDIAAPEGGEARLLVCLTLLIWKPVGSLSILAGEVDMPLALVSSTVGALIDPTGAEPWQPREAGTAEDKAQGSAPMGG